MALTGAAISQILVLTHIVYKREPLLHDDQLLVLSAGRGTTGTHLMFQATCLLGINSHHWLVGCIRQDGWAASTLPTNHSIPSRYTTAVRLHLELKDLVYNLSNCIDQQTRQCGSAFEWNANALKLIQEIILDGQISALHDTPYPNLLGQFYAIAKQYNRNVIIISSLRDPETYVKQRLTKPYAWNDLICKERISKINDITLKGGRFDLVTCIENALATAQSSSNKEKRIDLVEIFTTIRLLANAKEDGWREIANEVNDYQDAVKNVAKFTFDLFERGEHTMKEDMAKMIQEKVPAQPNHPPAQMVNWLTLERIGYDNLP